MIFKIKEILKNKNNNVDKETPLKKEEKQKEKTSQKEEIASKKKPKKKKKKRQKREKLNGTTFLSALTLLIVITSLIISTVQLNTNNEYYINGSIKHYDNLGKVLFIPEYNTEPIKGETFYLNFMNGSKPIVSQNKISKDYLKTTSGKFNIGYTVNDNLFKLSNIEINEELSYVAYGRISLGKFKIFKIKIKEEDYEDKSWNRR